MGHIWQNTAVTWNQANWTWAELEIVEDLIRDGVDATTLIQPWQRDEPYNPYKLTDVKQKRLIRLVCKVKGEIYDESKSVSDYKLTIGDVTLVVKAVKNIELEVGK